MLIVPDKTLSLTETANSLLSPVIDWVFNLLFPLITLPSKGIFSPGLITIVSPTLTNSGFTLIRLFSLSKLAYSGLIFIKSLIDCLILLTVYSKPIFA